MLPLGSFQRLPLVAVIFATTACAPTRTGQANTKSELEPIFNGRDLDGWHVVPADRSGDWTARDGVIHAAGTEGASYLVWKDDGIADFELELGYRMLTEGNTGVEIRARPDRSGKRLFEAYHADLGHVGIGPHILGAWDMHFAKRTEYPIPRGSRVVIGEDGKATTTKIPGAIELEEIKKRDWNRVRLVVRGYRMTLWINDSISSELVDNLKGEQLDRGFIALQLHEAGTKVEFKDVRLRKLRP